jgi:hypothetical protein
MVSNGGQISGTAWPPGRRESGRRLWIVWRGLWLFGGVFGIGLTIGVAVGLAFKPGDGDGAAGARAATEGPTWESVSEPVLPEPALPVVMDDLGIDKPRSARAIALPAPLTMAFLPYARAVAPQARAARAAGHELIVHVPMEPGDAAADPGPNALLTGLDRVDLVGRLEADLGAINDYVGISSHMGSRFTRDLGAMAVVMEVLRDRGLLFLDSRTSPATVGAEAARRYAVPYTERDVFLDNEDSLPAIRRQLATVEKVARRHGHAVALGHPRDATLEALAAWLREVEDRGFALVPLSAIVRRHEIMRASADFRG